MVLFEDTIKCTQFIAEKKELENFYKFNRQSISI